MTVDDKRLDRRIKWTSWGGYLLLLLILAITIWTLGTVSTSRSDQLDALNAQNKLLREQNTELDALVERQRIMDSERDERLKRAVDDVEALLVDYFAAHDQNMAVKLNEVLGHVADLVGRPAPTVSAPAPAISSTPAPSAPAPAPKPAAKPTPPSPTTTTPDQKSCAKHSDGPRC